MLESQSMSNLSCYSTYSNEGWVPPIMRRAEKSYATPKYDSQKTAPIN